MSSYGVLVTITAADALTGGSGAAIGDVIDIILDGTTSPTSAQAYAGPTQYTTAIKVAPDQLVDIINYPAGVPQDILMTYRGFTIDCYVQTWTSTLIVVNFKLQANLGAGVTSAGEYILSWGPATQDLVSGTNLLHIFAWGDDFVPLSLDSSYTTLDVNTTPGDGNVGVTTNANPPGGETWLRNPVSAASTANLDVYADLSVPLNQTSFSGDPTRVGLGVRHGSGGGSANAYNLLFHNAPTGANAPIALLSDQEAWFGAAAAPTVSGHTYLVSKQRYVMRLQAVGTLTRGKVWLAGTREPSSWLLSTSSFSGCTLQSAQMTAGDDGAVTGFYSYFRVKLARLNPPTVTLAPKIERLLSPWSATRQFLTDLPCAPISPAATDGTRHPPVGLTTNAGSAITFSWSPDIGSVAGYYLQVTTAELSAGVPDFTATLALNVATASPSYTWHGTDLIGFFYWRVAAYVTTPTPFVSNYTSGPSFPSIATQHTMQLFTNLTASNESPVYCCFDNSDNFYYTCLQPVALKKITTGGTISTLYATGGTRIAGVAYHSGALYFSDASAAIYRYDLGTTAVTVYAGTPATPGYTGDGGAATSARLFSPTGLDFDASGNLYICDTLNGAVRRVDGSTGVITTVVGGATGDTGDGGPAVSAHITPDVIRFLANGDYLISCAIPGGSSRIRRVSIATGVITAFAFTGVSSYTGDGGPALIATTTRAYDMAVDVSGNIFVCDSSSSTIRRIDNASGLIYRHAGTVGVITPQIFNIDALTAHINVPNGIALKSNGDLYICAEGVGQIVRVAL